MIIIGLIGHRTVKQEIKYYLEFFTRFDQRPLFGSIPRGGTLGISGWACATGTLEPLAYTRASSAEFCYPLLK